jgi:hypothetical protein
VAVTAAVALAWLGLVWGVGTHLVSEAYDGRGPGFLVRVFSARRDYVPVDHYLGRVRLLALGGAVAWLASVLAVKALWADARAGSPLARRVVLPASAASLAGIRIGACAVTLLAVLLEDAASTVTLPGFSVMPPGVGSMGLLRHLPGVSSLLTSAAPLHALKALCVLALVSGLLGLGTRWALSVALVCAVLLGGVLRMYTHFFHTGLLCVYLLAVLAFSPCSDAWSLAAWRRRRAGLPVAPPEEASLRYGFPRFACWAVIGLTYFAAGLSKLRHGGLGWWDGVNLKAKILGDALQVGSFDFPFLPVLGATPVAVFSLMGLATLAVELGMVLVPFSALCRRFLPLGVMSLHLGIFLAQEILFVDLILIQLIFFDFRRWAAPLGRWLEERAAALGPPARLDISQPGAMAAFALVPLVYVGTISLDTELYPITTWSMYSDRTTSPVVDYTLVEGRDASGRAVPVRLEQQFRVFRLSRDFDVIPLAFKPESRPALERTLDAFARAYNAERSDGERLVAVHFEKRRVDFTRRAITEGAGEVVERFAYEPRSSSP